MKKAIAFIKTAGAKLVGFCKRIGDGLRERFAGHDGRGVKFRPTKNAAIYFALLLFSILFTQLLRSPVSSIILIFMMILPFLALAYIFIGNFAIRIHLISDVTEVSKNTPVDFSLAVGNSSPLPFPFVDAMISVPTDSAVRCVSQLTRLSLIPFGNYKIEREISFAYRGSYEIGVSDIYVSDLLHLFCYRMDVNLFREIYVYPRRLSLAGRNGSEISSEQTESINRMAGTDNTEVNDIRQYVTGDSLRSIHWKLSSKTEELQVRQYARNNEKQTVIICDNSAEFDSELADFSEDINEFTVDGVIETSIALVNAAITAGGNAVTLVWFDNRGSDGFFAARIDSPSSFDEIFRLFATAPVLKTGLTPGDLLSLACESIDSASFFVVSGNIDERLAVSLESGQTLGKSSVTLYTFVPSEKIADGAKSDYFRGVDARLGEISRYGIRICDARDGRINENPAGVRKETDTDEE